MKRLLAQVAALSAAVLACACIASAGIVTPHRIDETFSGTSIDYPHTRWSWGTNQPDAVTFKQANGVMNINVAATAQNDFNVSGATLCRARGDFDATVDFNLATWPSGDGVWISLAVTGTPFNVYRVTWHEMPMRELDRAERRVEAERVKPHVDQNVLPAPRKGPVRGAQDSSRDEARAAFCVHGPRLAPPLQAVYAAALLHLPPAASGNPAKVAAPWSPRRDKSTSAI
jgi:hypothetical protein